MPRPDFSTLDPKLIRDLLGAVVEDAVEDLGEVAGFDIKNGLKQALPYFGKLLGVEPSVLAKTDTLILDIEK